MTLLAAPREIRTVCQACGNRKRCRMTETRYGAALVCRACRPEWEVKRCLICKRLLDVPGDANSVDCGGDCAACLREFET